MGKSAKQHRDEQAMHRVKHALKESMHIVESSQYSDDSAPMPMSYAVAAYGALRLAGHSPTEITQIFRDMPLMLGEEPPLNTPLAVLERQARDIGLMLSSTVGEGTGFVLVLNSGGHRTYLSNNNREDCIKMLRELVQMLETGAKGVVSPKMGEA